MFFFPLPCVPVFGFHWNRVLFSDHVRYGFFWLVVQTYSVVRIFAGIPKWFSSNAGMYVCLFLFRLNWVFSHFTLFWNFWTYMHNITARSIILFFREIRKPVQHVPCTLYMLCEALPKQTIGKRREKRRKNKEQFEKWNQSEAVKSEYPFSKKSSSLFKLISHLGFHLYVERDTIYNGTHQINMCDN